MSQEELKRVEVVVRVDDGRLTVGEAATLLRLSERQLRRILAAYRQEGAAALAHGNRGRKPANAVSEETRQKVVELATTKYQGYNHQHLSEVIEREGVKLSRSSVRRILGTVGLKSPRKRRPPKHRSRRERYPQEGMLVQLDGSPHDWLEGRGPRLTLHAAIDDATGKIVGATFRLQEDAAGYIELLRQIVQGHGIPLAVYHDRHDIFLSSERRPETLEEQLAGTREPTQVGRVLAELGIRSVAAHSPQAKGRVERLFQTLQDRLSKALREAEAKTLDEANRVLVGFIGQFNQRFAVTAAVPDLAYRALPEGLRPEEVFCLKYLRTVDQDNTVKFFGQQLQVLASRERSSYARARVEVHERLDGTLAVYHEGRCLALKPAPLDAKLLRARSGPRPSPTRLPADSVTPQASSGPVEKATVVPPTTVAATPDRQTVVSYERSKVEKEPAGSQGRSLQGQPAAVTPETAEGTEQAETANREEVPSHVDKWTGKRIYRPSTPKPSHSWRQPFKQTRVTDSLNA